MKKIDLESMVQYEEDKITNPKKYEPKKEPLFNQEVIELFMRSWSAARAVLDPDDEPPAPLGMNRSERRDWERNQALRLKLAGLKTRADT